MADSQTTLDHYWGAATFVYVWSEGHSETSNEVGCLTLAELILVSWYEEVSEVPPLKLRLPPIYVPPPIATSPILVSQYYVWFPETVLMARCHPSYH